MSDAGLPPKSIKFDGLLSTDDSGLVGFRGCALADSVIDGAGRLFRRPEDAFLLASVRDDDALARLLSAAELWRK